MYAPFFGNTGQTRLRIFGDFSRMMAQTTRTRESRCAFLGFVDIAPHLGGKNTQNPNFGGVNAFSSQTREIGKHAYYQNASIPTKFCTVIKTTKCPLCVVRTHITNPRWRTAAILEKSKNRHRGRILTDFDQIWHGDAVQLSSAVRPLKISKI